MSKPQITGKLDPLRTAIAKLYIEPERDMNKFANPLFCNNIKNIRVFLMGYCGMKYPDVEDFIQDYLESLCRLVWPSDKEIFINDQGEPEQNIRMTSHISDIDDDTEFLRRVKNRLWSMIQNKNSKVLTADRFELKFSEMRKTTEEGTEQTDSDILDSLYPDAHEEAGLDSVRMSRFYKEVKQVFVDEFGEESGLRIGIAYLYQLMNQASCRLTIQKNGITFAELYHNRQQKWELLDAIRVKHFGGEPLTLEQFNEINGGA